MGTEIRTVRTALAADKKGRLTPGERLAAGEAASPVVSADGRLVGLLSARTDVMAEQGGRGVFIPRTQFDELLEKRARYRYQSSRGARRRREITWRKAEGKHFVVYGIFSEKLD